MPKRKSADETNGGRVPVTVVLTPRANLNINRMLDRFGGSKSKLVETVLQWFADAPESVQHAIRGAVPDDMRGEYLKRIVDYFTDALDPKEAMEVKEGKATVLLHGKRIGGPPLR